MDAQRGGLRDGRAQIDADHPGATGTGQAGIAAAAAAGVKHQTTRQIARRMTPVLTLKRRLVLLGPRHVVTVPLPAETGGVGIRKTRQPGNPVDDRHRYRAVSASQLPGRIAHDLQIAVPAAGATDEINKGEIHISDHKLSVGVESRGLAVPK